VYRVADKLFLDDSAYLTELDIDPGLNISITRPVRTGFRLLASLTRSCLGWRLLEQRTGRYAFPGLHWALPCYLDLRSRGREIIFGYIRRRLLDISFRQDLLERVVVQEGRHIDAFSFTQAKPDRQLEPLITRVQIENPFTVLVHGCRTNPHRFEELKWNDQCPLGMTANQEYVDRFGPVLDYLKVLPGNSQPVMALILMELRIPEPE
jgi:hypothetical protein